VKSFTHYWFGEDQLNEIVELKSYL